MGYGSSLLEVGQRRNPHRVKCRRCRVLPPMLAVARVAPAHMGWIGQHCRCGVELGGGGFRRCRNWRTPRAQGRWSSCFQDCSCCNVSPGSNFPCVTSWTVGRAHLRRHKPAGLAMNLRCDLRRCRPREQDGVGRDQGLFGRSGMCVCACRRWSMQTPAMVFLVWEYGMGASR